MKPNKRGSKCAHKSESEIFCQFPVKSFMGGGDNYRQSKKLQEGNVFIGVCLSTGGMYVWSQVPSRGWVCLVPGPPRRYTPWKVHPREGTPLEGTPLGTDIYWWPPKRVVRILQECILVGHLNSESSNMNVFIFHDDKFHFFGVYGKMKNNRSKFQIVDDQF